MSSVNPLYRVTLLQSSPPGTQGAGNHILVEAPMPEQFVFDTQSNYATMLPQGLTEGKMATALAAFGVRLAVPALTAQLWQGSSEISLQLALEFHTENDPVADVQTPILNLNRLSMPSISTQTGLLQSPGPSIDFGQLSTIARNAGTSIANTTATSYQNLTGTKPQAATLNNTNISTNSGANSAVQQSSTQNPQLGTSQYWKTQISNQISIRIGQYLYFDSVVITNVQQTFMSNIDAITGLPHHATVNITFKPLFMLTVEDLASVFTSNQTPGQSSGSNNVTIPNFGVSIPSAIGGLSGSQSSMVAQASSKFTPPTGLGKSVFTV